MALLRSPSSTFAVAFLPYALLVDHFWFVSDDAFISFRYARNWAWGLGLRYNPGEVPPVEGYSDFLWVAVLALAQRCGLDPLAVAPLLSFAAGTLLLWLVHRLLLARYGAAVAVAGALFLGLLPAYACWSTGGLETLPFALLVFLAWRALDTGRLVPAVLAGVALFLIRTEGIGWALVLPLLATGPREGRSRRVATCLAAVGGAFACYFTLRYAWFQAPFANTVVAKVGLTPGAVLRGLKYDAVFLLTFLSPVAVLPALRRPLPSEARVVGAFFAWAAVVGGDHMPMGRLLVPALPFLALLFGRVVAVRRVPVLAGITALTVTVGLLPGWDLHLVPASVRARFHFRGNTPEYLSERYIWGYEIYQTDLLSRTGQALATVAHPGESVVAGAIGALGWYSGLIVHDQFGLVTPEVARLPARDPATASPGHDKRVDLWYFARYDPTYLLTVLGAGTQIREGTRAIVEDVVRHGLHDRYAPDFVPLDPVEPGGPPRFLFLVRRIPVEVAPAQAWQVFDARAEAWERHWEKADNPD